MIAKLNMLIGIFWCVLFLFFSNALRAEGSIYFRCVIGANEYLLSESDNGNVSYVNLRNANSTSKCNTRQIRQPVVVHQTRSGVA